MLDLYDLELFVSFARLGTLSRVAEEFHISTPSVTRSMQRVEEAFGVGLFVRGKNKIELSGTGAAASEAAGRLLLEAEKAVQQVREFDARQRTVVIFSCAPAPLWQLQRELNTQSPGMMISSAICQNAEVLSAWQDGSCDIAILPFQADGSEPFMRENLFVCVPPGHELAKSSSLGFAEINGFNFLLRTQLGFWDTLCREKMPASKFLVQTDPSVFDELVRESSLPCFATDYGNLREGYEGRVCIPLQDPEAHVTFHILRRGRRPDAAKKAGQTAHDA